MRSEFDPKREMLRHALATLAYRAGKVLREAPESYAELRLSQGSRTPAEILAHIGDVLCWGESIAAGRQIWNSSEPLEWEAEVERFFGALERFDNYLASNAVLEAEPERLLQGPIADILTHVGQLAMLRRLADSPIKGEDYFVATIRAGHIGMEHPAPAYEF